jgi:kynurenine formamidase
MQIRSFIIAYALVLAILLFADRRPGSSQSDRYSRVVDLTAAPSATTKLATESAAYESTTRIIAPATLIPGTWSAGHIPPERLVAPLVVLDLNAAPDSNSQISLDDIAAWETQHGMIPQGAVVAIRRGAATALSTVPFPLSRDAAMFLIEARYTIGFAVETPVTFVSDRTLARQLALHGNYVVERAARFTSLPATGSLIIVAPEKLAPEKTRKPTEPPVRILAMIR